MHTPCELLSIVDVENSARLMAAYCRMIRPDTSFVPGYEVRRSDYYPGSRNELGMFGFKGAAEIAGCNGIFTAWSRASKATCRSKRTVTDKSKHGSPKQQTKRNWLFRNAHPRRARSSDSSGARLPKGRPYLQRRQGALQSPRFSWAP